MPTRGRLVSTSALVGLILLALVILLASDSAAHATVSAAEVSGTIPLPGTKITAMAIYEAGNRLFVMDDVTGNILTVDLATNRVVNSTHVGSGTYSIVVSESTGKVYAASTKDALTTGINPGTGLVSILDGRTGALIAAIDPAALVRPPFVSRTEPRYYVLAIDDARQQVYVLFRLFNVYGMVIDARSNQHALISGVTDILGNFIEGAVNPVTGEAFFTDTQTNTLLVVNGNDLSVSRFDLDATGSRLPLSIAVNEIENKVYVTMVFVPGQGEIGILVLNRSNGSFRFVGRDDLEPFAFNPLTNRLFTGVQVGINGAIVEGATDQLTYYPGGIAMGTGAIAVRRATDHAFAVGTHGTNVIDGASKTVIQAIPSGISIPGGLFLPQIAVHQRSGAVYISPFQDTGAITILQDGPAPATPRVLTVSRAGSGQGTVSGPGILCGDDCSESLNAESVAGLSAAPAAGSFFDHWEGACTGRGPCRVSMDQARTVTAVFTLERPRGPAERVTLAVVQPDDGQLQVTVTPGCGSIREIRFSPMSSNTFVDIGGVLTDLRDGYVWQSNVAGPVRFTISRQDRGSFLTRNPFTARFVVMDECGAWPTFVGGGGNVS